jgi:hypothetical protein
MKQIGIILLQLLVTAAGLRYVSHDPQRRAQIAEALRHASLSWVLLGWICNSVVEVRDRLIVQTLHLRPGT